VPKRTLAGIAWLGLFAGICGILAALGLTLLVEVLDQRLKAPTDVKRVTGLSVIASAPDLTDRSSADRATWAFRTWITLQGRLSPALNHGLVCGLTSAGRGEGRSTWIKLLARAASECGYRVLTVTAEQGLPASEVSASAPPSHKPNGHLVPSANGPSALPSVRDLENKLVGPESQRVVQIPLPGWVWNLERRKQWQSALKEWQKMGNVVILVELPPASVPETVLLAQELPNLLWLTDSARSEAAETRAQLETLRNARCRLVGAVLNRAPVEHVRNRFARWMACAPAV
jgi:Mrp family chromosome partitioning ATPase